MEKRKIFLFEPIFKKLKGIQALWNLVTIPANYLPLRFFKRLPDYLIIEVSNICNLQCPSCPTPHDLRRPRGLMSLDLFRSIIDNLAEHGKRPRILMNFAGEPLLNSELPSFIDYAAKNDFETYISTNAVCLTPQMSENLIKAGLKTINVCLDGFSKEAHESYRIGSQFEKVKENIENFLKIKSSLHSRFPEVIIQSLITAYSEGQIDEIIKWGTKIKADKIKFKTINLDFSFLPEIKEKNLHFLPKQKKYLRKNLSLRKTICTAPLKQAVIFHNGDLGLCCCDYYSFGRLPNIKEKGFCAVFFSDEVARSRKTAFLKNYHYCSLCNLGNSDSIGFSVNLGN